MNPALYIYWYFGHIAHSITHITTIYCTTQSNSIIQTSASIYLIITKLKCSLPNSLILFDMVFNINKLIIQNSSEIILFANISPLRILSTANAFPSYHTASDPSNIFSISKQTKQQCWCEEVRSPDTPAWLHVSPDQTARSWTELAGWLVGSVCELWALCSSITINIVYCLLLSAS